MKFDKVTISRLLVGSLFIISGLIKANDPLGFSYKLEEYFALDVLNWTWFQGTEVWMAAFISIGEIVLGGALIAGEKIKLSAWLLLVMMVFFTFLTGYTAIGNWFFEHYDKDITHTFENLFGFAAREIHYFKDCGCFGDAIPFTPWDSFVKDIVLFVFTIIIFKGRNNVKPNNKQEDIAYYSIAILLISAFAILVTQWVFPVAFIVVLFGGMLITKHYLKNNAGWMMGLVAFVITTVFPVYTLRYLPVKDFRPFAIGQHIPSNMELQEGQTAPIHTVDYTMKSKSTGEETVVSAIEYLENEIWENKDLEIIGTGDQYLVQEGDEPSIHDFVLESLMDGGDYTYSVLEEEYVLLWVSYDLDNSNVDVQSIVNTIANDARAANIPIYELTASSFQRTENFKQKHGVEIDMLVCDATTLKTVIRSNPGLIVLKQGTVIGKYSFRNVESLEKIRLELNF